MFFKRFPGGFLKGPMVSEIVIPSHAENPLGQKYNGNYVKGEKREFLCTE
jgi:hypothetical protein